MSDGRLYELDDLNSDQSRVAAVVLEALDAYMTTEGDRLKDTGPDEGREQEGCSRAVGTTNVLGQRRKPSLTWLAKGFSRGGNRARAGPNECLSGSGERLVRVT